MIQFLNKLINNIFKIFRFLIYIVAVLIWIIFYPINRLMYERSKRKSDGYLFSHPNFKLVNWLIKIKKYFDKFIF